MDVGYRDGASQEEGQCRKSAEPSPAVP